MEREFELLSEDAIERLLSGDVADDTVKFNYCPDCNVVMNCLNSNYECAKCGYLRHLDGDIKDCIEDGATNLKMASGRRVYNMASDYSRAQRKSILDQLMNNNSAYSGPKIPHDVLVKSAATYNEIQKLRFDIEEEDGTVSATKGFVKRGNIKNEILGALVYFMCIEAHIARKKKDIAIFMQLPTNGISRGEDILRALHNKDKIKIPLNTETSEHYIDRYLESLGYMPDNENYERYKDFVMDLVAKSIEKKIGMNSIMSSKIVGALWILVQKEKLKIEANTIQDKCDGIKKNTWMRFTKAVTDNITKFIEVFDNYNIDHGLRGRVVKRVSAEVKE